MSELRAELDRIIDQHFEPSVMGRVQAVDDLMAAIDKARPAGLDVDRKPTKTLTGGDNIAGRGPTSMPAGGPPPAAGSASIQMVIGPRQEPYHLAEEQVRAAVRERRGRYTW